MVSDGNLKRETEMTTIRETKKSSVFFANLTRAITKELGFGSLSGIEHITRALAALPEHAYSSIDVDVSDRFSRERCGYGPWSCMVTLTPDRGGDSDAYRPQILRISGEWRNYGAPSGTHHTVTEVIRG